MLSTLERHHKSLSLAVTDVTQKPLRAWESSTPNTPLSDVQSQPGRSGRGCSQVDKARSPGPAQSVTLRCLSLLLISSNTLPSLLCPLSSASCANGLQPQCVLIRQAPGGITPGECTARQRVLLSPLPLVGSRCLEILLQKLSSSSSVEFQVSKFEALIHGQ
ncbi:homeobox protein Nkx-2.1 [Biomphalaria glabrata]